MIKFLFRSFDNIYTLYFNLDTDIESLYSHPAILLIIIIITQCDASFFCFFFFTFVNNKIHALRLLNIINNVFINKVYKS